MSEKFNSLMNQPHQVAEIKLCSLRIIGKDDNVSYSMNPTLSLNRKAILFWRHRWTFTKKCFKNHSIRLKKGTQPINLRPYHYSSVQKDVVERMVIEMLDSCIIQHNTSPFASFVVLVKKKDS